jgi:hypothetical protein
MCGDEMKDEITPVVRQRFEFGVLLDGLQGAEFVAIATEDRLVDRSTRLCQRTSESISLGVARRTERALPARRLITFVMQDGADSKSICRGA